jgi:hypothetical protein
MGKEKWYNSSHIYCQAKGWSKKELRKLSQWFWEGFLKWYDGGGENGIASKRIFEVEVFSPLKLLTSPFIWRDSWSFSFLFFYMLRLLWTWGFWWYLRRKSLLQKLLFKWVDMEWHGHDYRYIGGGHIFRNGAMHANMAKPWLWRWGVVDILAVDAYSGVEVCTPIFLGEASK